MLDFIMAVDDPVHWHQQNLEHNPTRYSFLRYSGAKCVAAVQKWVEQIYYNTRVEINGKVHGYSHDKFHCLNYSTFTCA